MIRRFKFEGDIAEQLDLVPIAVRRKLDRVGIKIGLEQWKALGRGERLAICHLPANLEEECEAIRVFIREAVMRQTGAEPRVLSEAERRQAEAPEEPPPLLVERAREFGFAISNEDWSKFDADERYVLAKLGAGPHPSHQFEAALQEICTTRARPTARARS